MIELWRLEWDRTWLLIGRFVRVEIFDGGGRTGMIFDGVPSCDLNKIAMLSAPTQFKIKSEDGLEFTVEMAGIWQECGRSGTDERDLREMGFVLMPAEDGE